MNAQKPGHDAPSTPPVAKSADEWKATLTPEHTPCCASTAPSPRGTSPLNKEKRDGMFRCAGCGQQLFASGHQVRQRHRLAQLRQGAAGCGRDDGRPQLRHDAHRSPLRQLRRPPRARVPGRAADDRRTLLHERLRADFRAEGLTRGSGGRACAARRLMASRYLTGCAWPAVTASSMICMIRWRAASAGGPLLASELGLTAAELGLPFTERAPARRRLAAARPSLALRLGSPRGGLFGGRSLAAFSRAAFDGFADGLPGGLEFRALLAGVALERLERALRARAGSPGATAMRVPGGGELGAPCRRLRAELRLLLAQLALPVASRPCFSPSSRCPRISPARDRSARGHGSCTPCR